MQESEFDKFADEYQALHTRVLGPSGESAEFFAEYKAIDTAREARMRGMVGAGRLLDFGCGVGGSVPHLRNHLRGWDLNGVDVSKKSLDIARHRFGSDAQFLHFDGRVLPFPDRHFALVFTACVFHHIPPGEHSSLYKELYRVLEPGGVFVLFEHNPLNPLTRKAVRDCPFDENAILIRARDCVAALRGAGFARVRVHFRIFFPAFLRWLRPLERALTWLPLGAQYYVTAEKLD